MEKCNAMKAGSTAMTQRPRDRVPSGSLLALPDPRRPDRANPPSNFDYPFFLQHWHDLHALGSHWTDSQQGILCWGFKGVQEEIPSEEASTLQIGSVAFPPGECTGSQLHPCQRLFDQDGHQDLLWDNWGDERGCDEGHWHTQARGLPWGLPEVVGMLQ